MDLLAERGIACSSRSFSCMSWCHFCCRRAVSASRTACTGGRKRGIECQSIFEGFDGRFMAARGCQIPAAVEVHVGIDRQNFELDDIIIGKLQGAVREAARRKRGMRRFVELLIAIEPEHQAFRHELDNSSRFARPNNCPARRQDRLRHPGSRTPPWIAHDLPPGRGSEPGSGPKSAG